MLNILTYDYNEEQENVQNCKWKEIKPKIKAHTHPYKHTDNS